MNMVPVPNIDGAARFIPADIAETKITTDWLREHNACDEGIAWFAARFLSGCTYLELRATLVAQLRPNWERWIIGKIGGDTAKAGDCGTAEAGDGGIATAGDGGIAKAGYRGTATAGYRGIAKAGDGGVISIRYFDHVTCRYRVMIGYIGEGGLDAGRAYRLNDQAQFVAVEGGAA